MANLAPVSPSTFISLPTLIYRGFRLNKDKIVRRNVLQLLSHVAALTLAFTLTRTLTLTLTLIITCTLPLTLPLTLTLTPTRILHHLRSFRLNKDKNIRKNVLQLLSRIVRIFGPRAPALTLILTLTLNLAIHCP